MILPRSEPRSGAVAVKYLFERSSGRSQIYSPRLACSRGAVALDACDTIPASATLHRLPRYPVNTGRLEYLPVIRLSRFES